MMICPLAKADSKNGSIESQCTKACAWYVEVDGFAMCAVTAIAAHAAKSAHDAQKKAHNEKR